MHYSDLYNDLSYNSVLVSACAENGLAAFTGDGLDSQVMVAATKAIGEAGGLGVPTVKPWNLDTIKEKMALVKESGAENILKNDLTYTDEEAETYYEELDDFLSCDTLTYTFSYSDDTSDEDAMTQKQAKLEANSLAACTDEESFKTWLEDYLKKNSDEELSEEDLTSQAKVARARFRTRKTTKSWNGRLVMMPQWDRLMLPKIPMRKLLK